MPVPGQVLAYMCVLDVVVFGLLHHIEWRLVFCRLHFFLFGRKLAHVMEEQCCSVVQSVEMMWQTLQEGAAPQSLQDVSQ